MYDTDCFTPYGELAGGDGLPDDGVSRRRRGGWRDGCARRCRSGRRSRVHRCRRRWAGAEVRL